LTKQSGSQNNTHAVGSYHFTFPENVAQLMLSTSGVQDFRIGCHYLPLGHVHNGVQARLCVQTGHTKA
jgi:hypothetical protein